MPTAEQTVKHTQGNLHAVTGGTDGRLLDARGRVVFDAFCAEIPVEEATANAAHAVRCWNSHDELIDSAKPAIPEIRCLYQQLANPSLFPPVDELDHRTSVGRALIALNTALSNASKE